MTPWVTPLALGSFPRAILHIDADAFFAACEQANNPKLKGKPVVTGKERGIASAVSYEAKVLGIQRGMTIREIRKICPDVIHLPSDYETYSLYSQRMFAIVRRTTDVVEEYSIDECFAELTGLRRALRMNYETIARTIKENLERELGMTFSLGLGPSKVVAKLASKWNKPSGLVVIPKSQLHDYLAEVPMGKIWGIGPQTAHYLAQYRITTALQFARCEEHWIKSKLTKPQQAIYQELCGNAVIPLELEPRQAYQSISKTKTFTLPSHDRTYLLAQLSKNTENACIKARRHNLSAQKVFFMLRSQDFRLRGIEIKLSAPTQCPTTIIKLIDKQLDRLLEQNTRYRLTGVVLSDLTVNNSLQYDLFGEVVREQKARRVFEAIDRLDRKYGKHTVFLGSSFAALNKAQHQGERAELPQCRQHAFKGETERQRIGLPWLGEVT